MIWYGSFILRRERKDRIIEMDVYEKWKLTDLRNEFAIVIVKLKNIKAQKYLRNNTWFNSYYIIAFFNKEMTLIFSFVCEYVKERRKALIKLRPQQSFNYTQFANYLAPYNFVKKKIIIIIIRKKKKKKN